MSSIKCLSLNCRGLNDFNKRLILYDWLHDTDCDIAFLQETHFVSDKEANYNARWLGSSYHCFSNSPYSRGFTILFKKEFSFKILNQHRSDDGRILLLNIIHDNTIITLTNIYAPNTEKLRLDFFKKVSKWISQYSSNDENVILVGDLNCDTASKKDKSSKLIQDIISKFSFIDLWS